MKPEDVTTATKEAATARRGVVFFSLAALLMTLVLSWMLSKLLAKSYTSTAVRPVVIASQELPAFTELKSDYLRIVSWPADSVPPGAFADVESVVETTQINLRTLLAGEPVVADRLSKADHGVGIAQLIDPQMRAFVVRVNDSVATAQLIQPGSFVDVISTSKDPRTREILSKVVLQNIEVLAVGKRFDPTLNSDRERNRTSVVLRKKKAEREQLAQQRVVTLLVTPTEMEHLAFVSRDGSIDLALRNNEDTEIVETTGVTRSDLMQPSSGDAASSGKARGKPARRAKRGLPEIYRVGKR